MKIVVLGGGRSDECDISLASSAAILDVLREQGHKAVFVDLFLGKKIGMVGTQYLTQTTDLPAI